MRTLVRRELVPKDKELSGKSVVVRCAHGDSVRYPLADLDIEVEGNNSSRSVGRIASAVVVGARCARITQVAMC